MDRSVIVADERMVKLARGEGNETGWLVRVHREGRPAWWWFEDRIDEKLRVIWANDVEPGDTIMWPAKPRPSLAAFKETLS